YTLKWKVGKITTTQYALYAIQIAVVILLSWLGVVATPVVGPGIGFLYWAYPFFIVFTWWWGLWGVLSAFIGCFIGAGLLTGLPLIPSLAFSVGDLVPALLVLLLYRGYLGKIGVDPPRKGYTQQQEGTLLVRILGDGDNQHNRWSLGCLGTGMAWFRTTKCLLAGCCTLDHR
ncbi:MAG: hypothetical protein ACP5GE_04330, partial [Thermoplasmata archaeon]